MFFCLFACCASAQTTATDSLRKDIRSYFSRNFSEIRTFNFSWYTSPAHTYRIECNGETLEKGQIHSQNTIRFNTTLPVLITKRFSLFASGQADFYNYSTQHVEGTPFFSQGGNDNNRYYVFTLNGMYRTVLAGKPLILNGNLSVDGHKHGLQHIMGTLAAVSILKRTRNTSLSAGLAFMWPFDITPVMPVLTYSHQFTPRWSLDVSLPRQLYMRYQLGPSSRFSAGCMLQGDHFYLPSQGETRYFTETSLNGEFLFEYVAMHHFYFFARGGVSAQIVGGIRNTNRNRISGMDLEYHRKAEPFMSLGLSYNLFK